MLLPPAKLMLKPNPRCDGIWRERLWEVGVRSLGGEALMNGISALLRQAGPRDHLAPSTTRAEGKNTVLNQPGRVLLPDPEIHRCLDPGLPSLKAE